jgi:hypothetical protein
VAQYVGLSLIAGFATMLVLDQGFLILQERQMRKLARQSNKQVTDSYDSDEREEA